MASTPEIAASCSPTLYSCIKDMIFYIRTRKQRAEDLRGTFRTLLINLITIKSRKEGIDDHVNRSISQTTNDEYRILKKEIEIIEGEALDFLTKYRDLVGANICNALVSHLDVSHAEELIDELKKKDRIPKRKLIKLARLDVNIKSLNERATMVVDRLKADNLIVRKKEQNDQNMLDEDKELPTVKRCIAEVEKYLDSKRIVGIAGSPGIGKTKVMKALKKRFAESVYIEYPKDLADEDMIVVNLQKQIMNGFEMKADISDDANKNEWNISAFLVTKKYILLIDGFSPYIDLCKLGLRIEPEKEHDGKVVIASRCKKVAKQLANPVIEIQTLSKEEAHILFRSFYGRKIESRGKELFLDQIMECCSMIPEEIRLLATHLKGTSEEILWEKVITDLQSDVIPMEYGFSTLSNAYSMLYKNLEDNVKKCLLYEALFLPDQTRYKDYLIDCWIAEEFIDAKGGFRSGRMEGYRVLSILTSAYLLIESSDERSVMMPKYFRRMAFELEYPGEKNCGIWLPDGKERYYDKWKTTTRISLINFKSELPTSPECRDLRTLLMLKPAQLSDDFFIHMMNLRMLDMQVAEMENLPESIVLLKSLRCLHLTACAALTSWPSDFGKLTMLQLLDISKTGIDSLPQEIRSLVALRCLRATLSPKSYKPSLKGKEVQGSQSIIPPKIIEELKMLEELCINIDVTCEGWENSVDESIVDELASLENLYTLQYNFPNMESLIKFASSSKSLKDKAEFRSFEICVGSCTLKHQHLKSDEREIKFFKSDDFSEGVEKILKQSKIFELEGAPNVKCLSKLDLDAMEVCIIRECGGLECVVNKHEIPERDIIEEGNAGDVFRFVKKLHLYNLMSLQHIWKGAILGESLNELLELILHGCPKLSKILNLELARALQKLKYLEVKNCESITHLVEVSEESSADKECALSILNDLETLKLSNLPKLESICNSTLLNWKSLTVMDIKKCAQLRNLLTLEKAKRLESITCESSWKNVLLADEENKWCKPLPFNVESSPVRAHHGGEASTSSGPLYHGGEASTSSEPLNPKSACNTNEISACEGEDDVKMSESDQNNHAASSAEE